MNKIKNPSNHNQEDRLIKRPNYALRRLVAATALSGTLLAGYRTVQGIDERVNGTDFSVDIEDINELSSEERQEQYETIVVQPGDTIDRLARQYTERHDLNVDYRQVSSALSRQGDTSVIHPGDIFYLPRQDSAASGQIDPK